MEDLFEVIEAPAGELATVFEGSGGLGLAQEVEREVFDDGHVFRPMPGPQAGEVVTWRDRGSVAHRDSGGRGKARRPDDRRGGGGGPSRPGWGPGAWGGARPPAGGRRR